MFANRYRLIKEVGRGSFGDVWLVRDESLDLEMALKVYIALDERGVSEFKGEYKITYALNHSNLLKANYFDVYESHPYLAMPYCPVSTTELIGKMDEPTAWRFVHDVAGGLAYLHSKSIVHRDIKPDNILRNEDGDFVITDFGISLKMRSTLRRNSTRKMDADIGGSFSYMAPELFSANPQAVAATDIWAFGVSLFELLVGELPFFGQGGGMLLRGAELPEVHGDFSDDLKSLVRSCLSKDTWERPTAEQLQSYAEAKLRGETPARPWESGSVSEKREGQNETLKSKQENSDKPKENQTVAISSGNVAGGSKKAEAGSGARVEGRKKKSVWLWGIALLVVFAAGILLWQNKQNQLKQEEQERIALAEARNRTIRVGDVQFEMVYVEGGTFRMGATEEQGENAFDRGKPVHRVSLSGYLIGKHEVTQGLWREVMGSNPSYNKAGEDYPVECVSWEDCQAFIAKLNARTGMSFRMPTEAEWEYAARGGKKSEGYKYAGSDGLDEVGWYGDNSGELTHPVGKKKPNELGLHDMSGNVFEWCQDWFGAYSMEAQTNPTGPQSGGDRVLRGGSCCFNARYCRVSNRSYGDPGLRCDRHGLRLALSL